MKKVFYDFSLDQPISGEEIERVVYNLDGGYFFCEEREHSAKGIGYYWGRLHDTGHARCLFIFCASDGFDSPLTKESLYSDLRVLVMKIDSTTEELYSILLNIEHVALYCACKDLAISFCNSI